MARVERYSSQQPLTVGQAQLVDAGAFPADYSSAELLKTGGDLASVYAELFKRQRDAQDSLSINAAEESRDLAQLQMQQFMLDNPDPEMWSKGLARILEKQRKIFSKQNFSKKAYDNEIIEQKAFEDELGVRTQLVTTNQLIENDIVVSGKNLIDGISNDDGSTMSAVGIDKRLKLYQEALARKYPEDVAQTFMEKTLKEAQKQREETLVNNVHTVIESGDYELARNMAKNPEIQGTKRTTLRNAIDAAEKSSVTAKNLRQKQIDDEVGNEFLSLLINKLMPDKPQLTYDEISSNPDMSFDAKTQWLSRLMTFDNYSEEELKDAFTDHGDVIADIYNKIDSGTLTNELDMMVGKGLSPFTAERIKKEIREPFMERTDKLFKTIFGWSPELGFQNDLSSFLYLQTERQWRQEIKKQNATGENIVTIGKQIARPFFIEHLKKTMMGQEADISRMVDLALGELPVKTEELKAPEPKEDEGPASVQDFMDEVARLKRIDMTKAKAYYDAWQDKFKEEEKK